jgi:prepilin signal peptidase PulO-like enzyme (type II secretory pathway)
MVYVLVFVVFFVALAVYDSKWFLLPDRLVFSLTAVAASKVIVLALLHHSWGEVWQAIFGAAIIFGLFWGIYQVSEGAWIGGGDVKLALALGLIAGTPLRALMVIFFASFFGTVASIPLILKGKKGMAQHIPFGPYLLLACLTVVLYADPIVSWYQRVFL